MWVRKEKPDTVLFVMPGLLPEEGAQELKAPAYLLTMCRFIPEGLMGRDKKIN